MCVAGHPVTRDKRVETVIVHENVKKASLYTYLFIVDFASSFSHVAPALLDTIPNELRFFHSAPSFK